tara:strand:+ start:4376 stop:4756 length:381 start_codon:yes stop_codon:yes gene_type:complete
MSDLPTKEQLLKDPITEKFVFLTSEKYPNQTCIGLTKETDFWGVVYKYGRVILPDETKLNSENKLNLKFEYDILENNGIPKEKFGDDFFKLLGDILYHIIIVQTPDAEEMNESDNRENDTIESSIQ